MKNRITSRPLMVLLVIVAILMFLPLFLQAKPPGKMKRDRQKASVYWEYSKKTPSGKHIYHKRGFGYRANCMTYNTLPIQHMNFKRYHFHRQTKLK